MLDPSIRWCLPLGFGFFAFPAVGCSEEEPAAECSTALLSQESATTRSQPLRTFGLRILMPRWDYDDDLCQATCLVVAASGGGWFFSCHDDRLTVELSFAVDPPLSLPLSEGETVLVDARPGAISVHGVDGKFIAGAVSDSRPGLPSACHPNSEGWKVTADESCGEPRERECVVERGRILTFERAGESVRSAAGFATDSKSLQIRTSASAAFEETRCTETYGGRYEYVIVGR